MNVYEDVRAALGGWADENGFALYSERALTDSASAPPRYCVVSVISNPQIRHADNHARAVRYRLQIDILVPEADGYLLPDWYEAADSALRGAGMLPQGNYRLRYDDNTKQAYTQEDYFYTKVR